MTLLAIDPGYLQSAILLLNLTALLPMSWAILPNGEILNMLEHAQAEHLAIERVEGFGMPIGVETIETVFWSGRFADRWARNNNRPEAIRIGRKAIKQHLCGTSTAKDPNVRRALIDRYGPGDQLAIGRKANPGPLYGMKADCWAALALAVTAYDTVLQQEAAA